VTIFRFYFAVYDQVEIMYRMIRNTT